jgi:alpha-methylacyl-CoA racemase
MAIMAALVRRATTGEGAYLDVSIADGVVSLMALYVDEYLATGAVPGPGHYILTGRYACYDTYRCADDRWVAVGAIEPAFYRNLCRLLDCERWLDHQLDDDVQDQVRADFAAAFARKPRDEWVAELAPSDTCVGPVYTVPELLDDPQVAARGLVGEATRTLDDGSTETFRQLGTVLAGTDTSRRSFEARPAGVTDTDELLAAAGLTGDEIATLREEGVVA